MRNVTTAIAATLFAMSANASDFYQGLGRGNPDLTTQRVSAEDFVGVQPSVGDSVDRYQGWAEGNPDLFKATGTTNSTDDPDIYMGISGNPDLGF